MRYWIIKMLCSRSSSTCVQWQSWWHSRSPCWLLVSPTPPVKGGNNSVRGSKIDSLTEKNICLVVKRLIMNSTCKGEIVASSPPDSEISLWSLSNCWIWSSMLLSKFCNIFSYILPSNSLLNASPVFLPSLSLPAVWCWTWWGPCPPPSPLQSTPPYPGRQASGRKTLKWSRTY